MVFSILASMTIRRSRTPRLALRGDKRQLRSVGSAIVLEDAEGQAEAKWVQIAKEGEYLGYAGGERPFALTRQTFEEVVQNIRRHPAFKADANGLGEADVIPWDFNHGSERDPTSGSLPIVGAPAHGWTRDLQVRDTEVGCELWALTRFLEPAKGFVKAGQYKWASVALAFDSVDAQTGENTGALITSIALTNTPFIEGMEQLVASKAARPDVEARGSLGYYESANSPEAAVAELKSLFRLPETSSVAEVMVEVQKISEWHAAGAAPLGVDLDGIVGCMRTIFNLSAVSTTDEVIAEADKLVGSLIDQTAPPAPQAVTAAKERDMEILKLLASMLGVREADDAVKGAVGELIELRNTLVTAFGLDRDSAKGIIEAATRAGEKSVTLDSLIEALGVSNGDGAISTITDLKAAKADLEKVQPELVELREAKEAKEESEIKSDVDAALSSRGFGEDMRDILTLSRKTDPEGFKKKFPAGAPKPAANADVLTTHVAATPQGTQLSVKGGSVVMSRPAEPSAPAPATGELGGKEVNLATYPGANDSQRMIAHLTATRNGFDKLKWDDQCEAAFLALEHMKASA